MQLSSGLKARATGGASAAAGAGRVMRIILAMGVPVSIVSALVIVALTVIGPRLLPYRAEAVLTASMAPLIPPGTELFFRPVRAEDVRVGDVIVFTRPDNPSELVTHRVVGLEASAAGPVFVTQGDANPVADGWRVPATGSGWRYWFAVPKLGQIVISAGAPLTRIVLIGVVVLNGTSALLRRLWRPRLERTTAPPTV